MKLDYGSLLSPEPIMLSIGSVRKPTLRDISKLSFDKFDYYESFMKISPQEFFEVMCPQIKSEYWDSLTDEDKEKSSMFDALQFDSNLQQVYSDMFNFFFVENVDFLDGVFVIFNSMPKNSDEIKKDDVKGIINKSSFLQVLDLLQQMCCIHKSEEEDISTMKFKSSLAREMYEKMRKAEMEEKKRKAEKTSKDFSIPNIISSVSNFHNSINPINVWDLTIYQLIDAFNRLRVNAAYGINSTRVSVWGDEKKAFDPSLWYKYNKDNN